jgi:hypothetical protein
MENEKLFTLPVARMKLDNLSGLCTESVDIATPIVASIAQPLLTAKLNKLTTDNETLKEWMHPSRGSALTPQIKVIDKKINILFDDIKRTVRAGVRSTNYDIAYAAKLLMPVLKPFWNVTKEAMTTQSAQLEVIFTRIDTNMDLSGALVTLQLTNPWTELKAANVQFNTIYDQRLEEVVISTKDAASNIKKTVVKDYENFMDVLIQLLDAMPTDTLWLLFDQLNDLRKKYAPRHRIKLDAEHTTVAPLAIQKYNGKHVTPLPQVFFKTGNETIELLFTKDYTVTYKNNVEVGEASLIVHGKSKFIGQYVTSFYIARDL